MKDPYWSLWGKVKSRLRKDKEWGEQWNNMDDDEQELFFKLADESDQRPNDLLLPIRGIPVDYNDGLLIVGQMKKKVKDDRHAVNTLRKLDTDDSYYLANAAIKTTAS